MWPSSRPIIQRSSLYWQLSTASPVLMLNDIAPPTTGPLRKDRTVRIMALATWVDSISCGR
jgi:hypothetical protein